MQYDTAWPVMQRLNEDHRCSLNRSSFKDAALTTGHDLSDLGEGGGYCHIGMCHCEAYGFQAVYSSIEYINQSVWV